MTCTSGKRHPVRPTLRDMPRPRHCQPLIGLVTVWLALVAGLPVSGASFFNESSGAAVHQCACKACRGETSCCCSSGMSADHSPAHSPPKKPSASTTASVSGPCYSAAPCGGDEGLPPNRPGSSCSKAVPAESIVIRAGAELPSLLPFREALLSASFDGRLDDPPEQPPTA